MEANDAMSYDGSVGLYLHFAGVLTLRVSAWPGWIWYTYLIKKVKLKQLTSVPPLRDAPCDKMNHRYFEFN